MNETFYEFIKQRFLNRGEDFTELFQAVLCVAEETGFDEALSYLERCRIEKRLSWLDKNLESMARTGNPLDDAVRIFYEVYLGLSIPEDGEIIERTDTRLVTRWWNQCPTLEACKNLGLDTRQVCTKAQHAPVQVFLSRIDPRLKFDRDYDRLRPLGPYCEEIITLEE